MAGMKDDEFPQIKRDLVNRIETSLSKIDDLHELVIEHNKIIKGDPVNYKRGLSERLNTLEDGNKSKDKWNIAIIPGFVLLVIETIWRHLIGHPKG